MSQIYRYTRPETMGPDDYYEIKSNFDPSSDGDWIAEQAAEDYHSHHDGWEACWPITVVISDNEGAIIGEYEVERESVPQFSAREVKK